MRIKKIIFAVFISLFLVVTLAINCFGDDYTRELFNAILIDVESGTEISYPSYFNSPVSYPIGAQNYINVADYIKSDEFLYYVDATIPDNKMYQLRLVYPPLSAMGTTQGEYEEYINNVSATVGIALTSSQYEQFVNHLVLYWNNKPLDTVESVKIVNSVNMIFSATNTGGTTGAISSKIYFLEISFHLNQPISIDDAWGSIFKIDFLTPNPFESQNSFTYYNGLHYQMATSDLSISTASLDDVVAEIGGKLDGINNNLIILQGLNEDILNALKENGYAEEVEEYINNVQNTTNKTDSLASREQALWDDVSFSDIGAEVDLGFFSNMSWLWNDWTTMLVISLCAIATISYGLFGGS